MMQMLREKWLLILAILAVSGILFASIYNPYTGPALIEVPVQVLLSQPESTIYEGRDGPVNLVFLASYEIKAAVKSIHRYSSDYSSQVSPIDLVLAWGTLNQPAIDSQIRYRQSNRWYYFQYSPECPVDVSYIQAHSANVHLIPADDNIRRQLNNLRRNDTVQLSGYLVAVQFAPGEWRSSLSREDSGDGACEIIYVTAISQP
jgi:hypothetical protein